MISRSSIKTGLAIGLLLLSCGLLLFEFHTVAHLAHRRSIFIEAILAVIHLGLGYKFYRWRYFIFISSGFTTIRCLSLFTGTPAHNLLGPQLLGLSAGIALYYLSLPRTSTKDTRPAMHPAALDQSLNALLWIGTFLWIGIVLQWLRTFVISYGWPDLSSPRVDRELMHGVSANFAYYLGSSLSLNILGPLTFILVDALGRKYRNLSYDSAGPRPIAPQILAGLAAASILQLIAIVMQQWGLDRSWAGVGDHARALNRVVGLLTDSGAAAIFLPLLWTAWIYQIQILLQRYSLSYSQPWQSAVRTGWSILWVLGLAGLAARSGRACLMVCGSLFLMGMVCLIYRTMRRFLNTKSPISGRSLVFAGLGLLAVIAAGIILILQSEAIVSLQRVLTDLQLIRALPEGSSLLEAFEHLDRIRTLYYLAGLQIWLQHPIAGSGLNSFMMYGQGYLPAGVAIDNPGGLWIGILSDTGLIGLISFILLWSLFFRLGYLSFQRWKNSPTATAGLNLVLMALPLAYLPASLIGYHILYPEFCILLSIPWLLSSQIKILKKDSEISDSI